MKDRFYYKNSVSQDFKSLADVRNEISRTANVPCEHIVINTKLQVLFYGMYQSDIKITRKERTFCLSFLAPSKEKASRITYSKSKQSKNK